MTIARTTTVKNALLIKDLLLFEEIEEFSFIHKGHIYSLESLEEWLVNYNISMPVAMCEIGEMVLNYDDTIELVRKIY